MKRMIEGPLDREGASQIFQIEILPACGKFVHDGRLLLRGTRPGVSGARAEGSGDSQGAE